ncbi:DUF4136 domain-containing protein [Sphingomonas sp. ID0503]|uniref:DUF4136 domain-containing protein n=1 Tax=Sphingomonas sp. ID0503 TaxID=3399691 RepID=UPI003AFACEE7
MSLTKKFMTVAAPAALLSLAACATSFKADVARFQAMPAPVGQSFYVQPEHPEDAGSLEFAQYAAIVGQRLQSQGYSPAASPKAATLVVMIDYGVDNGREKVTTTPGGFGPGWGGGPWGYGGWGGRGWGWGGRGYYWGWNDPWMWGGGYPDVRSYTVYTSFLDMTIKRAGDGQNVFEGHAKAMSRDDQLTHLVPNLIDAMFTNFPGRSGETVRITVPPPEKR